MNLILLFTGKSEELMSESSHLIHLLWSDKSSQVKIKEPEYFTRSMEGCISNTANDLFLYVTYRFFSLAYQTLITIFGNPTFIYSRHGFYKYVLFSFFHLFLRKSVGKGTEKYFPLTLMCWGRELTVVIVAGEVRRDGNHRQGQHLWGRINGQAVGCHLAIVLS